MLWVLISYDISPTDHAQRSFIHSGVNGWTVLCVPNDKCIVFPKCSQISVVRRESQPLHTNLHALEYSHRFFLCIVPKNNGCIRHFLKYSSELPCCDEIPRIWNCNGWYLHIMASQELLLMFVLDVFYDKQTPDVIDNWVFVIGMIVNSVLIAAVVTDWVL